MGQGIVNSIEKGAATIGFETSSLQHLPNAILINHSHNDHINELPLIIEKAESISKKKEIFCTKECYDQILEKFPQISRYTRTNTNILFNIIQPFNTFTIEHFSIMPIPVNHGDNYPLNGSVIYIIKIIDKKIIIG